MIGLIQANEIILGERLKARGNFDDNAEAIKMRITTFAVYEILQCICPNEIAELGGVLPIQFLLNTAGA